VTTVGRKILERVRPLFMNGRLAPLGALYDVARPSSRAFLSSPFNGQSGRRALIDDVLARTRCEVIVETGTFHGASTEYFARVHHGPVVSIEGVSRYFWYARMRLLRSKNLRLIHADSRDALRALSRDRDLVKKRAVFYLDAHWEADLPLGEELRVIAEHFTSWVAIVDDFAVPDDPGYTFDAYGPGKTLDLEYLERQGMRGVKYFWPRRASVDEDGMKRGCVVLTTVSEIAHALGSSPELRPHAT
jgi:hypothetical protein